MAASKNTVVLISGANRGLGKGLLELYLAEQNYTVIAANRDPNHATSKALFDIPAGKGSKLIVVKLDASVPEDAASAVAEIKKQGIEHLDVVRNNTLQYPNRDREQHDSNKDCFLPSLTGANANG